MLAVRCVVTRYCIKGVLGTRFAHNGRRSHAKRDTTAARDGVFQAQYPKQELVQPRRSWLDVGDWSARVTEWPEDPPDKPRHWQQACNRIGSMLNGKSRIG